MPPIVLEIVVDAQKGTVQLRQFDQAVAQSAKTVQQTTQPTQQASQQTQAYGTAMGTSAKSALQFATALTGVQLGLSGISSVLRSTVTTVTSFDAAMANVNTLIPQQTALQKQLREQIAALPPELGSSAEAAKALYEALSSGIPAGEAVQFVATTLKLAQAGLADTQTAATALTKTLQGYGLATKDAAMVSDVLFQTVNLGQGSLEQFAGAFPQIIQQAVQLKIPLKEAAATLATLSTAFPSAAEAATAYRAALSAVVENQAKFAAAGIDVQQTISESGLIGVLQKLQDVTGGNAARLNEFIPRIEAQNAVLALTGPLLQKYRDNLAQFQDVSGATSKALDEQTRSLSKAFDTFVTSLDRLAQQTAPPILEGLAKFFNDLARDVPEAVKKLNIFVDQTGKTIVTLGEQLSLGSKQTQAFSMETGEYFDLATDHVVTFGETVGQNLEKVRRQALDGGPAFQQFAEDLTAATAAVLAGDEAYGRIAVSQEQAGKSAATLRQEIAAQTAELEKVGAEAKKDYYKKLNDDIATLNETVNKLRLGETPKILETQEITAGANAAIQALERLQASGKISFVELEKSAEALEKALRDRLGKVPDEVAAALAKMRAAGAKSLEGLQADLQKFGLQTRADLQKTARDALDAFQRILESGEAVPEALLDTYLDMLEQINTAGFQKLPENFQSVNNRMVDIARKAGVDLPKPYVDAFGEIATASKKAAELIDTSWLQSRGALERARGTVEDLAESVVELTKETQRLMDLQVSVEQTFASDVPGLLKQLAQAQQEIQKIQGSAFGDSATKLQQVQTLLKEIAIITDKLKALGVDQFGKPLPGTGTGTGGTSTTPPASGTGLSPTAPTSLTRPGAPLAPTGGGGLGIATPVALNPTGPPSGSLLVPQGPQSTVVQRGATYNLTIQTQATDAATLARDLVPYLRQADLSQRTLGG